MKKTGNSAQTFPSNVRKMQPFACYVAEVDGRALPVWTIGVQAGWGVEWAAKRETSQKKETRTLDIFDGSRGGDDEKRLNLYFPQ